MLRRSRVDGGSPSGAVNHQRRMSGTSTMSAMKVASTSRDRLRSRNQNLNSTEDGIAIEDDDLQGFVIKIPDGIDKRIKFPQRFTERWGSEFG